MTNQSLSRQIHSLVMGPEADRVIKAIALWAALLGFAVHVLIWGLGWTNVIQLPVSVEPLFTSPLLALYTPFSILLVYEVYQLIQAIPKSFSAAMAKQFEVIALIVIRDALEYLAVTEEFEDLIGTRWFLLLAAKCGVFLTLLLVAVGFERIDSKRSGNSPVAGRLAQYVQTKYLISVLLFVTFVAMVVIAFVSWVSEVTAGETIHLHAGIFFADFFTLLIIADITILLLSYRFTSEFSSLARNTGFVLSTVLMRLAIDAPGFGAPLLFFLSGLMGLGVLWITSFFDDQQRPVTV